MVIYIYILVSLFPKWIWGLPPSGDRNCADHSILVRRQWRLTRLMQASDALFLEWRLLTSLQRGFLITANLCQASAWKAEDTMVPTPSYDVGCPSTTLSTNYATLAAEKNKNQKIKISSKTKNEKSYQKTGPKRGPWTCLYPWLMC